MAKNNTRRNAEALVKTVAGLSPDDSGNVNITASDVGAYSQTETDDSLADKQDVSTASKLVEPGSAIDVPVIATVAELPSYPAKSMMAYVTEAATVLVFNPETGVWDNVSERIGQLENEVSGQQAELDQSKQIYTTMVTPSLGDHNADNHFAKFTRTGNVVTLLVDVTLPSAQSGSDMLASYPTGYTPFSGGVAISRTFNDTNSQIGHLYANPINLQAWNLKAGRHEISHTYITNDPYPEGDEV